jgi:hypothetical protein
MTKNVRVGGFGGYQAEGNGTVGKPHSRFDVCFHFPPFSDVATVLQRKNFQHLHTTITCQLKTLRTKADQENQDGDYGIEHKRKGAGGKGDGHRTRAFGWKQRIRSKGTRPVFSLIPSIDKWKVTTLLYIYL